MKWPPVGLIESDWNLKENMESQQRAEKAGLIESDWNLKIVISGADALED